MTTPSPTPAAAPSPTVVEQEAADRLVLRGRVHQTLHLARDAEEVHAIVSVDAEGAGTAVPDDTPEAAEVIVIDTSTSTTHPAGTDRAIAEAATAAVREMRDGVHFAVLAGTDVVRRVWPTDGGLVPADATSRAQAISALEVTKVGGGTRIGRWLRAAGELLADHPGAIRHTILLTDGRNEHEERATLDLAIEDTKDVMNCDCRGVGDLWRFDELHAVSSAMHGTTRRVADASGLAEDFREMMAASMAKEVPEVALRLWTPVGARVRLVSQSAPEAVDLTARRTDVDEQVGLYPTGAWGGEQRDFHLAIDVPSGHPGQTRHAARVDFVRIWPDDSTTTLDQQFLRRLPTGGEDGKDQAWITATWTDDPDIDTGRAEQVQRAETENRIAEKIRAAMSAVGRGPAAEAEAEDLLRVAREWAVGIGQDELVRQIDELFDPETDTYRPGGPSRAQALDLEIITTWRPVQTRDTEG
ncbi:vWA domain-containing protein [Actinomycetospora termitidis]|uniref:VWA domain-containing protein n=1 Tax=Actinomycetospora termitidis TaxID=3053470 RepID=A0ABT7ME25_9PSEU|nr:vWA domain-containing protein [Actinomycetospora sp. Odt1-22]MDL5158918.1 vWA domain-containing protein [Actinomycetospora sp. Odt1-22]